MEKITFSEVQDPDSWSPYFEGRVQIKVLCNWKSPPANPGEALHRDVWASNLNAIAAKFEEEIAQRIAVEMNKD